MTMAVLKLDIERLVEGQMLLASISQLMIERSRLTAIISALLPNWLPLKNKATQNRSEPKNQFQRVFSGRQRVILPVIHVISLKQAVENAKIAFDANADGIFLINHAISSNELLAIHARMVDMMPNQWIGVNCLGWSPIEVVQAAPQTIHGIWVDHAQIEESQVEQPDAERVEALRQSCIPQCLYFGGVAFKYQRDVVDLETVCRIAKNYMDVVTTSGPGTGCAAPLEKIRRMRQALKDWPLAIASGITPNNVIEYLPFADCFLVASGISKSFELLDSKLTRDLVKKIHAFQPSV